MKKTILSNLIIWCLLLTIFTQNQFVLQQVDAKEDEEYFTEVINDFDIGDGQNQFNYHGTWGTTTGPAGSGNHNNDEHWSTSSSWDRPEDVYFEIKFSGKQIKLFGIKAPAHGIYAISIDGGEEQEIDAYAPSREYKQLIYDSGNLTEGDHTLKLRATGEKNEQATRPDVQIDYAEVKQKVIDVTGIEMEGELLQLEDGMPYQLTANVLPENATNKNVRWSSSDEDVVSVDDQGRLKAGNVIGTATITAKTEDGDFTATREVNVTKGEHSLKGAVGTTDMHYVKENTFREDYKRIDFDEIITMTDKAWEGTAWKGDRASAQFVLWTTNKTKQNVSMNIEDLVDGKGNKIASSNITANFVKSTKAARGNPAQGKQELIPDILGSDDPVNIEKFNVQPIWISVDIPRDAVAGDYTGELSVKTKSGEEVDFTLKLEVLDITLPEVKDWEYFLDLWQNPFAVARINGISKDKLWSKEHFDVMRPHYKLLADAGQKVITTTVTHDPWNSQTYDPYESMVKWTKKSDGSYAFDFEVFDKWVQFMMDLGIDQQIDAYSMVSWASKIKYYDEVQQKDIIKKVEVGTTEWYTMWGAFLEAFVPHLEEKGWLDKTYMANDERALNHLIEAADLIDEKSDGSLKITAAMNYNNLFDNRIDRIDNISLAQILVNHNSKELSNVAQHRRSLGLNTTLYTMVGTYPSNFVRSNPAEPVWVIWNTMRHNVDGFLRWAYDSFVEDPFETSDFRTWESGDSFQVYPGATSSVRFEKMKEGIRDAEKVRYISEREEDLGEKITNALWNMKKVGIARDPFGGVKGSGNVSIPDEVNKLRTVLHDVTKEYIDRNKTEQTNKALLDQTINDAKNKLDETEKGTEAGQYPGEARDAFKAVIVRAEQVLKSEFATQKEVDEVVDELSLALEIYADAEIKEDPPQSIDKAALESAIVKAEGIDTSVYTESSVEEFESKLHQAIAVIADENAAQQEVDTIQEELLNAIKELKKKKADPGADIDDDKETVTTDGEADDKGTSSNGQQLPNTSTSIFNWMILGLLLSGLGIFFYVTVNQRKKLQE
ncbi:Bacterial Ig-like domain (group 2) [Paraliobacillus sp. PM-2]|uniref:glycoside hydrolase domain-containing protein n=1 Tax=Paraliobacillus sp. PM-2 TaxID=1462524 RepID=UPI00061B8B3B|nr:glycoside hydrolase domain-containing protein [Paraliobacillus sp. PM-2]CQR47151.1 Bacterial Ig-like domain (group 2) [Paraliobacillus sp. PM-2]